MKPTTLFCCVVLRVTDCGTTGGVVQIATIFIYSLTKVHEMNVSWGDRTCQSMFNLRMFSVHLGFFFKPNSSFYVVIFQYCYICCHRAHYFHDMCRMQQFLAILRSFFLSSVLCTFSCHPSSPTVLPSPLTSSCHLFLGLPLSLVVPKFI